MGDTLRVRLTVARGDSVGARLCERLLLSLADADGDPDGDGVLLPESEGDAPCESDAVADAVSDAEGVALALGGTHAHDTSNRLPGAASPNGATATRKRERADVEESAPATSGSCTRDWSPQLKSPPTGKPPSSLLATQPNRRSSPGSGHPVPTNSWLSNLVRALHVLTTSVPPEPGAIDEGSAGKSASSSPSVTANTTDLVLP